MVYTIERAFAGALGRWRRNLLVVVAVALSAASLVTMLALSIGSSGAIVDSLNNGTTNRVQAALPPESWLMSEEKLLRSIIETPGVVAAGTMTGPEVSGLEAYVSSPAAPQEIAVGIAVATNAGLSTRGLVWLEGSYFPSESVLSQDPAYVIVGSRLARDLGVSARSGDNTVTVNGRQATVAGIVEDAGESASLSTALIAHPDSLALYGETPPTRIVEIEVKTESVAVVTGQAPLALWGVDASGVSISSPPDPRQLRLTLEQETSGLIATVTWVMIGVSVFVVANTMQMALAERRREIGVVRAFGVSRASIALQFFVEAAFLALTGSLAGVFLGGLVSAGLTLFNGWDLSLPVEVGLVPIFGLAIGGIGGLLPAWNASKVRPIELLR